MNSAMMGALSGAAGGLSKYGEIQGEQRKYNMDQKKIQAEPLRKENFARFQHDLTQSARGSGMVTQAGQEYTKAELEGLPEGERTSALSKYDYQEGVKTRQAEKTAGKKAQLKAQEISKEWTTSTGDPITNQEAEKLLETPEGRQQLMNRLERDVAKESRVATQSEERAEGKAKLNTSSKFHGALEKLIMKPDEEYGDPSQKTKNIVGAMKAREPGSDDYKKAMESGIVREAVTTDKLAAIAKKAAKGAGGTLTLDSTRVKAARKELEAKGVPKEGQDKILAYAGLI